MRFNKLALVLAVILIAGTAVPALAKSPFADVPADHWAYDAVVELAAAGLIEGYPDGTFGGSRMMTRYEAAMVFARALARLERKIAETDILAELDLIKAELMEEVKAALAAFDVPVETKILEKVIVDKDVDEATLARIAALEMGLEVVGGDLAYVEHRVLGLIDGIRYDLNQFQGRLDELAEEPVAEYPSLEEIEELIAAKVEEGILEAALSAKEVVKETTVIEKVVEEIEVDGLTEEDVERIAEALIAAQLQKYDLLLDETRTHLYNIYTRLDDVEAAQAETAAAVKALEKVRLSGDLSFSTQNVEDEYGFTQSVGLNLNIKASDVVNVKTVLKGGIPADQGGPLNLSVYGVEVTSETPLNRLAVGNKLVTNAQIASRISGYALKLAAADAAGKGYRFAALADVDLFKDLTANVFLGTPDAGAASDVDLGLALQYKLIPELGIKAALGAHKAANLARPEADGVYAGIFGEIAGITYGGDFALDLGGEEENMLFGGSLKGKLGPLGLSGKYVTAQDNYQVGRPFILGGSSLVELSADLEFLGIDVDGAFYREFKEVDDVTSQAFRFGAGTEFDLFVPINISGEFALNQEPADLTHTTLKVALAPAEPDLGFRYGADFALVLGEYARGGNWKNGKITEQNVLNFGANLGYKADVRGAILDLGYGASFRMPYEPEDDNVLTHKLNLGYNFTPDVKLTLGGSLKQVLKEPVDNTWEYSAGLGISF